MRKRRPVIFPKCSRLLWSTLTCAAIAWGPELPTVEGSNLRRSAVVQAVADARPAVVNIHGRKTVRPDQSQINVGDAARQVNGMGTGIVIDERGYVLTNFHVVDGVGRIQVTLANKEMAVGELVSHDPKTDLAVIKIESDEPLPVIKIGRSYDLMAGESVIAVGNAYGYEHTVTTGIISALNRSVQVSDDQKYDDLIQTDASINPGNSGGPLLNIDGELVGINVAVRVGAQGIGFAIPIDQAMEVAARLMSLERIQNMTHGVGGRTVIEGDTSRFEVATVRPDSPAAKAGLQSDDIVTAVDQQPVDRALDFERALVGHAAGEEVEITVQRGGESTVLSLILEPASRLSNGVADRIWNELGLKLASISATSFREYNSRYRGGLKVTAVRPDSPAAAQGVRRGDVLVGMHKWETLSLDNVGYVLGSEEFQRTQPFKFYILRGSETLFGHMRVGVQAATTSR